MVHAAYLRTYLPATRVPAWEHHVEAPRRNSLTVGEVAVWDEPTREDAFAVEWEGGRYVCPRHPRLRMLEGLLAFRNAYTGLTAALLVPESVAQRAVAELEAYQGLMPDARSYILTSPWHVPLRWFVAFDSQQREVFDGPAGPGIRYRNDLADGLRRVEHAVSVLEDVGFEDVVIDQVRELASWLGGFEADAMIELDYGTVAELFSPADIALDDSAAEVASSLAALADGDFDQAGIHYAAVASRWAPAQTLAFAN